MNINCFLKMKTLMTVYFLHVFYCYANNWETVGVKIEQPGEECITLAGSTGTCTNRMSCNTLDHDIDIRGNKCAATHVCCPNTNYHVPTPEWLTVRPWRQRPVPGLEQATRHNETGQFDGRCRMPSGVSGACKALRECSTLRYNIDNSQCGTRMVCCMDTNTAEMMQTTWAATVRAPQGSGSGDGFNCRTAGRRDEALQCGSRKSLERDYISRPAEEHEFPWMVVICEAESKQRSAKVHYLCGGSLIHYQVVLTAAHCVDGKDNLLVRAGAWKLGVRENHIQQAGVTRLIIHQDYNTVSIIYDVALVIVSRRFEEAPNVGLMCLPTPNIMVDPESCMATGWSIVSGVIQPLRMIFLPLVDSNTCQKQLARVINRRFTLHESFVCAGGGAADTCKGSGGSPLVCTDGVLRDLSNDVPHDGVSRVVVERVLGDLSRGVPHDGVRYYQRGIVSWGLECGHGQTDVPGVYSDVEKVIPWISDQMLNNNLTC